MLRLEWCGRYPSGRHHQGGPAGRRRGSRRSRFLDHLHRIGRRYVSGRTNRLGPGRRCAPREDHARTRRTAERDSERGRRPDRPAGQGGSPFDEGQRGMLLHTPVYRPLRERESAPHERREPAAQLQAPLGRPDPRPLLGPARLSLPGRRCGGTHRDDSGALGTSRTRGRALLHPVDDRGVRLVHRPGPRESMRCGQQEPRLSPPARAKSDQRTAGDSRSRPREGSPSPHQEAGPEPERCIERPVPPCRRRRLSHGHVAPRFSSSIRSTSSPTYSCRSDGVRARMSRQDQCRWYAR